MRTKTAAKGLALLMLTGTLSVAAPQAASASNYLDPCNLSTKIDELRGWGSDTRNNVVVWKSGHQQSGHFNNIVRSGVVRATPVANLSSSRTTTGWCSRATASSSARVTAVTGTGPSPAAGTATTTS